MPTVVQFRRGTTAQNNNFTGAAGEISYDNELNSLRVHNGSTAGGFSMVTDAGIVTMTNKTFGDDILVDDSDVHNIGTINKRFANAYLGTVHVSNGILKATPAGVTVTTSDATTVASYETNGLPTVIEYSISATDTTASKTEVTKVIAAYDGTNMSTTEYGTVFTGDSDLGSFTTDLTSTLMRLRFVRRPANDILVKAHQTIIT
jgi:hypothetical protein